MNILLCGAHGFLGRHIDAALVQAGHSVVAGVRTKTSEADERHIDFGVDTSIDIWCDRLKKMDKIDVVINAVGILSETPESPFSSVHEAAPIALFAAAEKCGLRGIIQISALGPDHDWPNSTSSDKHLTRYMQTKRNADAYLLKSTCAHLILRPSLVVGLDGDSSRLFRTLASLPVIALPGDGQQQLQPVHIDDVCAAIVVWLGAIDDSAKFIEPSKVINATGPTSMTYLEMLLHYRSAMQLAPPLIVHVPMSIMRISARLASHLPQKVFAPETLIMLEQNNIADCTNFAQHLKRSPKSSQAWFAEMPASMLAAEALANWSLILLRISLAIVWIIAGVLSMGVYSVEQSMALLSRLGLAGGAAHFALYFAASIDLVLGISCLVYPRRFLYLCQIVLIVGYSLIISIFLPEFLMHPFGPVIKNLPILVILFLLTASAKK